MSQKTLWFSFTRFWGLCKAPNMTKTENPFVIIDESEQYNGIIEDDIIEDGIPVALSPHLINARAIPVVVGKVIYQKNKLRPPTPIQRHKTNKKISSRKKRRRMVGYFK